MAHDEFYYKNNACNACVIKKSDNKGSHAMKYRAAVLHLSFYSRAVMLEGALIKRDDKDVK